MKDGIFTLVAGILLAVGIAFAGCAVGHGIRESREPHRHVTVKGIAERTVKSDLALWRLRFVASGQSLADVQAKLKADAVTVTSFLGEAGIPPTEIEMQGLQVTDLAAEAYRSDVPVNNRFIVGQTLSVRATDVDRIARATQDVGKLVDAGVVLSSEMGPSGNEPIYLFTKLNEIKPEMIAEATKNARAAAAQFATDSGSALGGIRTANQGLFQILARDDAPMIEPGSQVFKTVRIVSTVEYSLE